MEGVTPGLTTGPATDAISGEQMILTAAGIDPHVHLVSPQQAYHALSGGVTTLIGGGIGPTDGTNGTTITSGIWNMEMMLKANEGLPVNVCMSSPPPILPETQCAKCFPSAWSVREVFLREVALGLDGVEVVDDSTPQSLKDFVPKEIVRWTAVVKASGVKLD